MFCNNCNSKIPDDSLFCPYCDAPQSREASQARDKAWAKAGASKRYLYGLILGELALIIILSISLANRPVYLATLSPSAPVASLNSIATYTPFVAIGTPLPGPASIRDLVVKQQHSDDFSVYMVLADAQGNMVQGEGDVKLNLDGPNGGRIFSTDRTVKPENFVNYTDDSGNSALIYSFGLFNYSDLGKESPSGKTYTVHLIFTPKLGNPLTKDASITLQ